MTKIEKSMGHKSSHRGQCVKDQVQIDITEKYNNSIPQAQQIFDSNNILPPNSFLPPTTRSQK